MTGALRLRRYRVLFTFIFVFGFLFYKFPIRAAEGNQGIMMGDRFLPYRSKNHKEGTKILSGTKGDPPAYWAEHSEEEPFPPPPGHPEHGKNKPFGVNGDRPAYPAPKLGNLENEVPIVMATEKAAPTNTLENKKQGLSDQTTDARENTIQSPKSIPAPEPGNNLPPSPVSPSSSSTEQPTHWVKSPERYPIPKESIIKLPSGTPKKLPKIQFDFKPEDEASRTTRLERQKTIKEAFKHSWTGYRTYAWGHDEVMPVSKTYRDPFAGWAATVVDALDTLLIMGFQEEFEEALALVEKIDFTTTTRMHIPVFETVIRYLGGLLGAYDIGGQKHSVLVKKATELGDILYSAFDTQNRMPTLHYNFRPGQHETRGPMQACVAELGSMSLEFTRLAQITGNNLYYDAIERITSVFENSQNSTSIPGMWPDVFGAQGCVENFATPADAVVNDHWKGPREGALRKRGVIRVDSSLASMYSSLDASSTQLQQQSSQQTSSVATDQADRPISLNQEELDEIKRNPICTAKFDLSGNRYGVGSMADSGYEYLMKQYILLGGLNERYKTMYQTFISAAKKTLFYRPMVPGNEDILAAGAALFDVDTTQIVYENSHLTCFVGGMVGMAGKLLGETQDVETAIKLTDGCVWAYKSTPSGLMPENFLHSFCKNKTVCNYSQNKWYTQIRFASQDVIESAKIQGVMLGASTPRKRSESQGLDFVSDNNVKIPWDQSKPAYHAAKQPIPHVGNTRFVPLPMEDQEKPYKDWLSNVQDQVKEQKLPKGMTAVTDHRYILRPEAVESIWYMYRITGDKKWQDKGWEMWQAVEKATRTKIAYTAVDRVLDETPEQSDNMESFWFAETLKYYYLLFSEPSVVSLDDYVLNTEAHPLRRPK